MNTDRWNKRLEEFQGKLKDQPNHGLLWLEYAEFLDDECDNPLKTVRAFERAQELLSDLDLRVRLGAAYDRAGDLERAVSLISESLAKTPRPAGYCVLANVYLNNEMYQEAIRACQKALELDADYEEAYYLLGEAMKHSSRRRAIECFREAIKRDPEYQLAWQALGSQLVQEIISNRK